jgi:hypothetical protein
MKAIVKALSDSIDPAAAKGRQQIGLSKRVMDHMFKIDVWAQEEMERRGLGKKQYSYREALAEAVVRVRGGDVDMPILGHDGS